MMRNDDFASSNDAACDKFESTDGATEHSQTASPKEQTVKNYRRRLEELLEDRKFSQELKGYDDYADELDACYDTEVFNTGYEGSSFEEDYT